MKTEIHNSLLTGEAKDCRQIPSPLGNPRVEARPQCHVCRGFPGRRRRLLKGRGGGQDEVEQRAGRRRRRVILPDNDCREADGANRDEQFSGDGQLDPGRRRAVAPPAGYLSEKGRGRRHLRWRLSGRRD